MVVRPGGEQRRRHELERAVLRARDPHPAGQGRAAGHLEALHAVTLRRAARGPPVRGRRPPRLAVMTVRLTRIYTKTGDAGQTHLGDMSRVAKTDPRLVAYADVDEANSVARGRRSRSGPPEPAVADLLRSVQNDLFDVGADLCTPITPGPGVPAAAGDRGLHRAARGGLRRVQRGAAEAGQLHPARAAPRPRRCCTRRGWSSGGPSAACGRCWRPTRERTNAGDRALPQPAVGPAVHPGAGGQPRRRRAVGARRAQRRARPARRRRGREPAGDRSAAGRRRLHPGQEAGHRRGVHRQLPRALGGRRWRGRRRPAGSARSSRPGLRRDSTWSSARQSRSCGPHATATAPGTRAGRRRRTRRRPPTSAASRPAAATW